MENSIDIIVTRNDASEVEHYSVDERSSRYRKFCSRNGKYYFDVNNMINYFFISDHQRCFAFLEQAFITFSVVSKLKVELNYSGEGRGRS